LRGGIRRGWKMSFPLSKIFGPKGYHRADFEGKVCKIEYSD
jgi:hypothetical protein